MPVAANASRARYGAARRHGRQVRHRHPGSLAGNADAVERRQDHHNRVGTNRWSDPPRTRRRVAASPLTLEHEQERPAAPFIVAVTKAKPRIAENAHHGVRLDAVIGAVEPQCAGANR